MGICQLRQKAGKIYGSRSLIINQPQEGKFWQAQDQMLQTFRAMCQLEITNA